MHRHLSGVGDYNAIQTLSEIGVVVWYILSPIDVGCRFKLFFIEQLAPVRLCLLMNNEKLIGIKYDFTTVHFTVVNIIRSALLCFQNVCMR